MAAEPVEVARNEWGAVLHHEALRTLELLAGECERFRPASVLVDSMEFLHRMGEGVNEWRDEKIVPRYHAAGVARFAFLVPEGVPGTVESGGTPAVDGPANFPTGWFSGRERAVAWLAEG